MTTTNKARRSDAEPGHFARFIIPHSENNPQCRSWVNEILNNNPLVGGKARSIQIPSPR